MEMISRLLYIVAFCATTISTVAEDGESQALDALRNELAEYDRIKVSELLFPGCTGPVTRGFIVDFERKELAIFSESAFGKRSENVFSLDLSQEEVQAINDAALLHYESAVREDSVNEQMMAARAAGDLEAINKLHAEHPVPIGGHASLIVEIQIRRSDQEFTCADQLGEAESWKAFSAWISSVHARASRTDGANKPEQPSPTTR